METYCKSLHPDDYTPLSPYVAMFDSFAKRMPCSVEHFHRRWESTIALAAFAEDREPGTTPTLLEVGSGGSLFAPLAAAIGYQVTVCDPSGRVTLAHQQAARIRKPIEVVQHDFMTANLGTFDYVACLSVIEHVEDDAPFWWKLLRTARRGVALTTDFSPDGRRFSADHLRTYTPEMLEKMCSATGWEPLGAPQYDDNGPQVFDYSFASVALVRGDSDG